MNFEDSVSVTCVVSSGDLPVNITWFVNTDPVNLYNGITTFKSGKRSSVLTIDSVHAGHVGNYTCRAQNPVGSDNHTAGLNVNG